MFGGGGSQPDVPPPTPAPTVADTAVQQAVAEAVRRKKMSRGYRSTILGSMAKANQPALPAQGAGAPGKAVTVGS